MNEHNIISVSGGKDSTALLLLAIERNTDNMQAVFADTGNEHQQTYDFVRYLEQATGVPILWVKADFSEQIIKKREFVITKWFDDLVSGRRGRWILQAESDDYQDADPPLNAPNDIYTSCKIGSWKWRPEIAPLTPDEANKRIAIASEMLVPTGNPFLDLCLWKGRFASTKARFCSEELKRNPIINQVQMPIMESGGDVVSWQGVRRDESENRKNLIEMELKNRMDNGAELWNYRPILDWTAEDVFAMHTRHGIKPNPLYSQGMGRVGCMPCIHARKDELLEISSRFPEEISRIAKWEGLVSKASKRGKTTFFSTADGRGDGVYEVVEWSKTSRGGKNYDLFRESDKSQFSCSSIYGLCE